MTSVPAAEAGLKMGEVVRRTGVKAATLRAWEHRHGFPRPPRPPGTHRLYDEADVAQILDLVELLDQGWALRPAIARVRSGSARPGPPTDHGVESDMHDELVEQLWQATGRHDSAGAHRVLDDALARYQTPTVLDGLVVPVLRRLGEGWHDSPESIAREHFGSQLIRARLARLLLPDTGQRGPCVACCPEGEMHDLGLLMAAVVLAEAGWRIDYLGVHTPPRALGAAIDRSHATLVLICASDRRLARRFLEQWPAWQRPGLRVVGGGRGSIAADVERLAAGRVHEGTYRDLPGVVDALMRPSDSSSP